MNRLQQIHSLNITTPHTILTPLFLPLSAHTQTSIQHTTLPDKVEYRYRKDTKEKIPWFRQQIGSLANVVFG